MSLLLCVLRLRVRKKTWKNPTTIFCDKQKFDDDITLLSSTELFAELLDQPERVTGRSQVSALSCSSYRDCVVGHFSPITQGVDVAVVVTDEAAVFVGIALKVWSL